MKRPVGTAALLAVCTVVSLGLGRLDDAGDEVATSAIGDGTMSFGEDGDGRAYLRFNIEDGDPATGTLLFAAEDHHEMFPDVVVQLGTIEKSTFKSHSVEFSGLGRLHDDLVTVAVTAHDNGGADQADRFVIKCTRPNGKVVFKANGELFRGDILIEPEGGQP